MDNIDYEIFSLPFKEVRIVSKERYNDESFLLWVMSKIINVQCTKCGWYNTKRLWKWYNEQVVNHLFLSNYSTVKLRLYKRKFTCKDCEKWDNIFVEWFSFIDKNCSYTKTYAQYILKEREYSSLSELARKFQVSETLIYKVIDNLSLERLQQEKIEYMKTMDEIYLWVDEISFSWHDMICTITDVVQKKVLWVLPTRRKKDLVDWLERLDVETLKKIKGIATDMNATYKDTIQSHIAKKLWITVSEVWAKAVADHFHLVQMQMKLINQVYRMNKRMINAWHYWEEIQDLCNQEVVNTQKYRTDTLKWTKEYVGNHNSYKPITLWFFLSKRYVNLLTMKQELHTEKQADRLWQIFAEFDPCGYLKEARVGKELLIRWIKEKSIDFVDELIHSFKRSGHYLLKTAWKTIEKRREEIQNFFELWITNAYTEWKNTKAKLFKRMAYGYYKKENYMKRLLVCL